MSGMRASLDLVVWDVQHGSAIYVRTPNSTSIAIDLGVGSYKSGGDFSPLRHLRCRAGVEQLDAVIVTHPHTDHINDVRNFEMMSPRVFYRPRRLTEQDIRDGNRPQDQTIIDKYMDIDSKWVHPIVTDPCNPSNNGGVSISTFIPAVAGPDLNNASLVCVISYLGLKVVVPGDNETKSWTELLGRPDFCSAVAGAGVLVASHHGRDSGYHAPLFEHITPCLTVISDGRFGDTSATSRYSAKTTGWLVNRRNGTAEPRKCVTTRSDGCVAMRVSASTGAVGNLEVYID